MKIGNKVDLTFLGERKIRISRDELKKCKFYAIKPHRRKRGTVNHHILLVDVSVSMYEEILNLKERLKITLDSLLESGNNYVSVILYSGHGETYRIINATKCDKVSYEMARVYEVIDEEVYARGVTVMSEPLNEAIETVKKLADVCKKHHISLFTDGCLVPLKWNVGDEEEKCFNIARICNEEKIYLNAIGFGKYYDREFLKRFINTASTGTLLHIDEIKDYSETVLSLINEINNKEIIEVEIDSSDFFWVKESKRFKGTKLLEVLEPNKNNIIVSIEDDLQVTDAIIKPNAKRLNKQYVEDFLYSLSRYHIINEDIDSAEVAIAQTGDINAYDMLSNCYSFTEKGNAVARLTRLINNKSERFLKGRDEIKVYSLEEEPICILEILREILADPKSSLLWDFSYKYKRISMKTNVVDEEYSFIFPEEGYGEVVDISIGSKKLNIGIKVKIPGQVQNLKSKLKLDAKVYRDYNLVVNGNINTPYIFARLSRKLKSKFRALGILKKNVKWKDDCISILDLNNVKATNKRTLKYLDSVEIARYLYDIEELKCRQWVLNQLINGFRRTNTTAISNLIDMPEEEKMARKAFGVNEKSIYIPRKLEKDNNSPYDVYPAIHLEWKVERFPEKKYKDEYLHYYRDYMKDHIVEEVTDSYEALVKELIIVKAEKRYKEELVNIVRISSGITNKPVFVWDNQEIRSKTQRDNILNTNMVVGEKVIVSTKVMDNIVIREDRYIVLTKCN